MKFCNDCSTTKPLSEFYNHRRTRDGKQTYCKPCWNSRQKVWYEANKTRHNRRIVETRRKKQLSSYGIEAEGVACEVCSATPNSVRNGRFSNGEKSGARRLSLDHDHTTGAFRGWLCHRCNAALGLMNDDPALLVALAQYVARSAVIA